MTGHRDSRTRVEHPFDHADPLVTQHVMEPFDVAPANLEVRIADTND